MRKYCQYFCDEEFCWKVFKGEVWFPNFGGRVLSFIEAEDIGRMLELDQELVSFVVYSLTVNFLVMGPYMHIISCMFLSLLKSLPASSIWSYWCVYVRFLWNHLLFLYKSFLLLPFHPRFASDYEWFAGASFNFPCCLKDYFPKDYRSGGSFLKASHLHPSEL